MDSLRSLDRSLVLYSFSINSRTEFDVPKDIYSPEPLPTGILMLAWAPSKATPKVDPPKWVLNLIVFFDYEFMTFSFVIGFLKLCLL